MRRSRITITLEKSLLKKIDNLIDKKTIRNRSHAIEYIINQHTSSTVKQAVILAGGRGTQLRPYTYEIPKPMLPVGGKPILEHLIEDLRKNDITEIIIAISYLGNKIKRYFENGDKFGVNIFYSEEEENLLTGGALQKIKSKLKNETFLVIHGDIVAPRFNYADFIQFHKEETCIATVGLTTTGEPMEFGQTKLQGSRLTKFYPVSEDKPNVKSHLIHGGIYAFEPEIFDYFPKKVSQFSLEDIIRDLVNEGKVCGYVFEDTWFDVGNPENYGKAIRAFQKKK